MTLSRIIEAARWVLASVAIYLGYAQPDPAKGFTLMCLVVVLAIAGLTGLESVFMGKAAARESGYADAGPYQRQSGLGNLAVAAAMVLVWLMGWGVKAMASVMIVMLCFLVLSAINHAYSGIKEGNRSVMGWLRPMLTGALLAGVLPLMVMALGRG